MSFKIVVMSCDKNQDLWQPFHECMEKYWKDHPEIIYSTETIQNPYYKTICINLPIEKWTRRVCETVKDLPCKHILLMVDDLFLRDYVNNSLMWKAANAVSGNYAALNLEYSFDPEDHFIGYLDRNPVYPILVRNSQGKYLLSCMCQMWQKRAILDLFNVDMNPWEFEKSKAKHWWFLISKYGNFINWGKPRDDWQFGVIKGKWAHECKEFFDKEGIEIDYSIRGFIEKGQHR